ncbi:hypothetical protein [Magnetospirillum sp. UT-4]|uniref:Bbp19 family protein n=1 Tax=Magnetospirillum sp. UT-4 TaxID=2681467 RepID=UPI001383FC82|nr:hypothetical protein [Magnetospirillum sp. UT-4]CAA7621167.1 hypothetical protein MTBUT4_380030 [Magnetospirillum sp. UT-4]
MADVDPWLFPEAGETAELEQGFRDLARLFARVFRGKDGKEALAWIRGVTIEKVTGPGYDQAALKHLEGQRFLAARIIKLVEEGRKE